MRPVEPVLVADLFGDLHDELLGLLRGLDDDDWVRATSAGHWTVHDVAGHLLDGDIRRLSIARDGHAPPAPTDPIEGYDDLVTFLNELNATWVRAARRISPTLLIAFLERTGPEVAAFVESLDPFSSAPLPVAWAGDETSPNWLDIAREYTERWHHQDQIREAVGAPALVEPRWLEPVVDTSLRGVPHAYRAVDAERDTAVAIEVAGESGGRWSLVRRDADWTLLVGRAPEPACRIALDAETAARLLLHRLSDAEARDRVAIEGDERLGRPFLDARAVMV